MQAVLVQSGAVQYRWAAGSKYLLIYTTKGILVPTVKEEADVPSAEKAVFGCKTKQQNILTSIPHSAVDIVKKINEKEAANT